MNYKDDIRDPELPRDAKEDVETSEDLIECFDCKSGNHKGTKDCVGNCNCFCKEKPMSEKKTGGRLADINGGLTIRDYFAAQALIGRLANGFIQNNQMVSFDNSKTDDSLLGVKWEAEWAYRIADAMIAERERP